MFTLFTYISNEITNWKFMSVMGLSHCTMGADIALIDIELAMIAVAIFAIIIFIAYRRHMLAKIHALESQIESTEKKDQGFTDLPAM